MTPRALFISDKTPQPGSGGAMAYAFDFLQSINDLFEVECVPLSEDRFLQIPRLPAMVHDVFALTHPRYVRRGATLFSAKNWLRQKSGGRFFNLQLPNVSVSTSHPIDHCLLRKAARRRSYQLVISNYFWKARLLDYFPNAKKAILAHDVFHQHVSASNPNRWENQKALTAEREVAELNRADIVIAISDNDARIFEECGVTAKIVVAPMSARQKPKAKDSRTRHQLLFIGSPYIPNIEGIRWFAQQVWPLICRQDPDARLNVVGGVCQSVADIRQPGINLLGHVKDISEIYRTADVVIVPILRGTGMKIKLVESIDYETPFVSTTAGALGLESLLSPEIATVTDDPNVFAMAAAAILGDVQERDRKIKYIRHLKKKFFAPEAAHKHLRETLVSLI